MTDLSKVETIIMVMLENRSFDHMLGHLSYGPYANGTSVDGLQYPAEQIRYLNPSGASEYYPFEMDECELLTDVPHESEFVATQLSDVDGQFGMNGFAEAYFRYTPGNQTSKPQSMGFMKPEAVPITTFLANEYAVCDRWFAPLPTSTQPNKFMALTGDSPIVNSQPGLPMILGAGRRSGDTVFDWLDKRSPAVPWRIYSCGLSFLTLIARNDLLDNGHWRPFSALADDFSSESGDTCPRFIYIEPEFGDSPIHLTHHPCDNHPPLGVGFGEHFLRTIYDAITSSVGLAPRRWARTVMIITYDEHGGFYDHVPPPRIRYDFRPGSILLPGQSMPFRFESTGPRVPTIIVSPFVRRQTVFSSVMDHTSILQLLAEKWGEPQRTFSETVRARRDDQGPNGIVSVSQVLDLDEARTDPPPVPSDALNPVAQLGAPPGPKSVMQEAFEAGARKFVDQRPDLARQQLPGLMHWAQSTDA